MKNVIEKLEQIQVDSLAVFVKLHNYHWNIKGMQFYPIHEMTEKIYDKFSEIYDESAELILQLGGKPVVSMKEVLAKTQIQEDSGNSFEAKYVLENIIKDYEIFMKSFKELLAVADENGDNVSVAFADENIAAIQKDIWMIKATLA
ncbi:MAG TPA: DNA starvation/stationary phase protection protein [Sulfurospirillum sp. UBA12182]|jgi:starvation-inducible DNA-binding protein|nr:MAG TPA: DNA starvation/stationary phase protection protein [Sulfurospirillum sp. UBA12182]